MFCFPALGARFHWKYVIQCIVNCGCKPSSSNQICLTCTVGFVW